MDEHRHEAQRCHSIFEHNVYGEPNGLGRGAFRRRRRGSERSWPGKEAHANCAEPERPFVAKGLDIRGSQFYARSQFSRYIRLLLLIARQLLTITSVIQISRETLPARLPRSRSIFSHVSGSTLRLCRERSSETETP